MNKKFHVLILIVILMGTAILWCDKPVERLAREKGVEAEELWEQGNFVESAEACKEAIRLFNQAVTEDGIPEDVEQISKWLRIAFDCYVKTKDYVNALDILEQIIETDPENMKYYGQKAILQKKLERFDDALETYKYIHSVKPSHKNCNKIASIYKNREDWENALKWYEISYELRNDSNTIKDIAVLNLRLGRTDAAIKAYEGFLATDPPLVAKTKTYKNIGKLYEDTGNINKALENYEKSIELRYNSDINLLLISKYYELGKHTKAMDKIDLYLQNKPGSADAIYYRAMIKYDKGELISAREDFEKLLGNPTYDSLAKGFIESINSQ